MKTDLQKYLSGEAMDDGAVMSAEQFQAIKSGRLHADGTPCKAKSPESCPFEKRATEADIAVSKSAGTPRDKHGNLPVASASKSLGPRNPTDGLVNKRVTGNTDLDRIYKNHNSAIECAGRGDYSGAKNHLIESAKGSRVLASRTNGDIKKVWESQASDYERRAKECANMQDVSDAMDEAKKKYLALCSCEDRSSYPKAFRPFRARHPDGTPCNAVDPSKCPKNPANATKRMAQLQMIENQVRNNWKKFSAPEPDKKADKYASKTMVKDPIGNTKSKFREASLSERVI